MTSSDTVTLFAMAGQAPAGQPAGGGLTAFLPLILILGIFYVVIWLPMRRQQKRIREFQGALKVGDRIVTTSGIYGSITKLNDKSVQVEVADRVRIEVSRSAVGGYQGEEPVVQDRSGS